MALNLTLVRRMRGRELMPAYVLAGLFMAALGAVAADGLMIPAERLPWLLLLAFVVVPASLALIMTGPRYISAAEVALLMLLETALGPLWVWLVLGEEPPAATLFGGAVIIGTLLVHIGRRACVEGRAAARAGLVGEVAAAPVGSSR